MTKRAKKLNTTAVLMLLVTVKFCFVTKKEAQQGFYLPELFTCISSYNFNLFLRLLIISPMKVAPDLCRYDSTERGFEKYHQSA